MNIRSLLLVALRISVFLGFVWLAREFFAFGEIDACLDSGGIIHQQLAICTDGNRGEWKMSSGLPYLAWVLGLGAPALLTFGLYALIRRWVLPQVPGAA